MVVRLSYQLTSLFQLLQVYIPVIPSIFYSLSGLEIVQWLAIRSRKLNVPRSSPVAKYG